MTTTLEALLSRDVPQVLADNLVVAGYTLGKLAALDETTLKLLGLHDMHITAIRQERPSIEKETLKQLLEESWGVCCVCERRERGIVIHHIKEWSDGGTHEEANLAVLCLFDHERAHLSGGHSKVALSQSEIRDHKKNWKTKAKSIRESYNQTQLSLNTRSARWLWVHFDQFLELVEQPFRLYQKSAAVDMGRLRKYGLIDENGIISPVSEWQEPLDKERRDYVFDSSAGQMLAIHISDMLNSFVRKAGFLDITEMLQSKKCIENYVREGSFVFFRSQIDILQNPQNYPKDKYWVEGSVSTSEVKLEFNFNLMTSTSMTSMRTHLLRVAERSIVGQVVSITPSGAKTVVGITPLGISPDFLLHDPSLGDWLDGADNSDFEARSRRAGVL